MHVNYNDTIKTQVEWSAQNLEQLEANIFLIMIMLGDLMFQTFVF